MPEQAEQTGASQPGFDALPLHPDVRRAIDDMGFDHPTPVQLAAFEPACAGADLIVQARTGTGKTLGFGLPLVDRLVDDAPEVQALVLAPTRELALQSAREFDKLARYRGLRTVPVYGGASMEKQIAALKKGAQIVSGTPGRVLDHIRRQTLDPRSLQVLVLDEADEMFSMGFAKELNAIMDTLPSGVQTLCFSATIDTNVERIAERRMRDPQFITLSSDAVGAAEISHYVYMCLTGDKLDYLKRILDVEDPESAILFCNTKAETEAVARALQTAGYNADWLNGDLPQSEREKIMRRTREGKLRYMVATDVAARGIDISHLTHVFNYGFPEAAEQYVHRTGRTGRAGRTGTAISIVGPENLGALYYLRLTYKIFPLECSLPSDSELKTRQDADLVQQLVTELAGSPSEAQHDVARRLLDHPQGQRVLAGLIAHYFEPRAARPRRRARKTPSASPVNGRAEGDAAKADAEGPPRKRKSRSKAGAQRVPPQDAHAPAPGAEDDADRASAPPAAPEPMPVQDESMATLYLNVGKRHGVAKAEISGLLQERAQVSGDDLGRVRVRDRHTFVGVPAERADEVIQSLAGAELGNVQLVIERARS